jgi:hypothetical protein
MPECLRRILLDFLIPLLVYQMVSRFENQVQFQDVQSPIPNQCVDTLRWSISHRAKYVGPRARINCKAHDS